MEVNLLGEYPKVKRDYDKRLLEKTPEVIKIAKKFGKRFFDGERKYGYGGYKYDGRWKPIVAKMQEFYNLPPDASILDIGCGKGFMVYDFQLLLPDANVRGIDISKYAIKYSMPLVKSSLIIGSAEKLPFADKCFDLVVSINSIHNLPIEKLKKALKEINRVCRGNSYITVDAWRTKEEKLNLHKWVLTAETMMHIDDWKKLFEEVEYKGDYWWFIAD
jgi:ubiquinone/menaquinone biosynthesis C-methylase UbiE